jgi:hypothetical protein
LNLLVGSDEEHCECLDILHKLIQYDVTKKSNIQILVQDITNIELLLDLLEHDTITISVMSSQILSQIHCQDAIALETSIQLCPTGMNKLLQRLPDRSREEVSNQALILIQQLTANNEEMKKTVAFNEVYYTVHTVLYILCIHTEVEIHIFFYKLLRISLYIYITYSYIHL